MRLGSLVAAIAMTLSATVALADGAEQKIRQALSQLPGELSISSVSPSPVSGLYEVVVDGGRVLYASEEGQYLLSGHLLKVEGDQVVNLTQQQEMRGLAEQINRIDRKDMVIFPAQNSKTHITVFTDTDCGYCQKLHAEVPELNRRGVEVRYLAFPRGGVNSSAYQTLVNVWCANDRNEAMNLAKSRRSVPQASCSNPVAAQYELGVQLGVSGTPSVILANGQMIPGYQPADVLAAAALQAQ